MASEVQLLPATLVLPPAVLEAQVLLVRQKRTELPETRRPMVLQVLCAQASRAASVATVVEVVSPERQEEIVKKLLAAE